MSRRRICSLDIDIGSYASFIDRIIGLGKRRVSASVCVANVHMIVEAAGDPAFADIINGADLVTPDGIPVAKSIRLLYGIKQDRVAGMDLVPDLITAADSAGVSVFFYGSTDTVLTAALKRISEENPGLKVAGAFSPPFRTLTPEEQAADIDAINSSGAQLVLMALGCPKQERLMSEYRGRVHAVMVGIGGALLVYSRLQKRAPVLMQRLGLEWLFRLGQEPRRLFRRYLATNTLFLIFLGKAVLKRVLE